MTITWILSLFFCFVFVGTVMWRGTTFFRTLDSCFISNYAPCQKSRVVEMCSLEEYRSSPTQKMADNAAVYINPKQHKSLDYIVLDESIAQERLMR